MVLIALRFKQHFFIFVQIQPIKRFKYQEEANTFGFSLPKEENASASFERDSVKQQIVQEINENAENGAEITARAKYKKHQYQHGRRIYGIHRSISVARKIWNNDPYRNKLQENLQTREATNAVLP